MPSPRVATKADRELEDAMLAHADNPERVAVITKARAFKRTWLDLAEALSTVTDRESWTHWGFASFDEYCRKELHLKKSTVSKLLGSFRFLQATAPRVIERAHREPHAPLPSLQAVDFVARATERAAADDATLDELKRAAFDDVADSSLLSRRYREVAFPVDEGERLDRLRGQLTITARRLAGLIAEPDAPVPHPVAIAVEEALGQLLDALDAVH